jgi:rsbT co-antagonist protein RsbR
MAQTKLRIQDIVKKFTQEIVGEWIEEQLKAGGRQKMLLKEEELRAQCKEFLALLSEALQSDAAVDLQNAAWSPVRDFLAAISRSRGTQGFTPSETATFIFSLKRPLFARLRREIKSVDALADETWAATELLDKLGLYTTEIYLKTREEVILRQQQDMMELSTPVVKLWEGVLALPLIGTLDSARTQVVMEALLQKIVETGSEVAIIDITGVPTVDTLVAQHLLKTVTAARLMGADCIISGIRPQIAQTIVHLGVTLHNVSTKASLSDAFLLALQRTGMSISRSPRQSDERMT